MPPDRAVHILSAPTHFQDSISNVVVVNDPCIGIRHHQSPGRSPFLRRHKRRSPEREIDSVQAELPDAACYNRKSQARSL